MKSKDLLVYLRRQAFAFLHGYRYGMTKGNETGESNGYKRAYIDGAHAASETKGSMY